MPARPERFKVRLAVYLIVERDGHLLMLRRKNTGYQDGNYGLIQGHVDGGETAEEAIAREAKEEAGLDVDPRDIEVVHVQHSPADNEPGEEYICLFLKASTWSGEPENREPDKCDDIRWFPKSSLPENAIASVRDALRQIEAGNFYSNWGWEK